MDNIRAEGNFHTRCIVERTNTAEIRLEEQSEKADNCWETLGDEIQLKGAWLGSVALPRIGFLFCMRALFSPWLLGAHLFVSGMTSARRLQSTGSFTSLGR